MKANSNHRIVRISVIALLISLAYGIGSKAIDTGSWFLYLLTALIVFAVLRAIVRLIKNEQ